MLDKTVAAIKKEATKRANLRIARLKGALHQIHQVCEDNTPSTCNQAMALAFVKEVAASALRHTVRHKSAAGKADGEKS